MLSEMPRPPSLLSRALEPLAAARWTFFAVWSVVVGTLWFLGDGWTDAMPDSGLRSAAMAVAGAADLVWLLIGSVNLYLHLVEREGLARARMLAAIIVVSAWGVAAASVRYGYPLGFVIYTSRLGSKLGMVPLGWTLLWFVIGVSGRALVALVLPAASIRTLAVCTGIVALLTDLNLESIATEARLYWFWLVAGTPIASTPPWRNFATWFVLAAFLAWSHRDERRPVTGRPAWKPALVLVVFNVLLLTAHLRRVLVG